MKYRWYRRQMMPHNNRVPIYCLDSFYIQHHFRLQKVFKIGFHHWWPHQHEKRDIRTYEYYRRSLVFSFIRTSNSRPTIRTLHFGFVDPTIHCRSTNSSYKGRTRIKFLLVDVSAFLKAVVFKVLVLLLTAQLSCTRYGRTPEFSKEPTRKYIL